MVHWDKEGIGASFNERSPAACVETRIIFLVRDFSFLRWQEAVFCCFLKQRFCLTIFGRVPGGRSVSGYPQQLCPLPLELSSFRRRESLVSRS